MPLYLLHISPPYKQAGHYLGYTSKPEPVERVAQHMAGRGSPLIRAALAAGHEVTVARKWPKGTRTEERQLKNRKNTPRTLCPVCKAEAQQRRQAVAATPERKDREEATGIHHTTPGRRGAHARRCEEVSRRAD